MKVRSELGSREFRCVAPPRTYFAGAEADATLSRCAPLFGGFGWAATMADERPACSHLGCRAPLTLPHRMAYSEMVVASGADA